MVDAELFEPPRGHLRQHRTLIRNGLLHHDVEGADPIGRDEQQPIMAGVVDFPNFAAPHVAKRQDSDGDHAHTLTSSRRGLAAAVPLSNGATTSDRNSSTCCGARPTNLDGSITSRRSSTDTLNALSEASRSSRSLAFPSCLTARAAAMLCCRIRS